MSDAHALDCPACRAIDQADGVEDGRLHPVMVDRIGDERRIVRAIKHAQDRVAGRVASTLPPASGP